MTPADNIWQIALALVAVVGIVFALGVLAKRMQVARFRGDGGLQIVGSTYLGPRDRLVLVRVADKHVLVGVNQQCIANLGQFDAPEEEPDRDPKPSTFASAYQRAKQSG